MEAPGSRIHVEQLVFAVAGVAFELHFADAIEIDGFQEALPQFLDFGKFGGLDISCRPPEFTRMLPLARCYQAAVRLTVAKKGAVRELGLAVARDNFLDHDFPAGNLLR